MKNFVYVDYENMGNLKSFPKINGKYFFFIGVNQKSIPKSLVFASNENEVEWVEIDGNGKNALDFHIAYYLAKNDTNADTLHFVLSKDKGFDSLLSSINRKNKKEIVKRIININDINTDGKNVGIENKQKNDVKLKDRYDKVVKNLKGIDKSKRPKSENKLKSHIQAFFFKTQKISENELNNIIDELYRNGIISKGKNRISYSI